MGYLQRDCRVTSADVLAALHTMRAIAVGR
jgi:hypothetical protein